MESQPTTEDLQARSKAIRARRIVGMALKHTNRASDLFMDCLAILRARRGGDLSLNRAAAVLDECEGWPSGLRDQVLDRLEAALRARPRG